MLNFRYHIALLFCLLMPFGSLLAKNEGIPPRPVPQRLVNNLSVENPQYLSEQEVQQLEQQLEDFSNQSSNQVVVVITDDLAGYEAWDYATRLGHAWGVGQAKFDNGVVILIKPSGGQGQRDAYIAVGYGLEGAIPDATAKQILENELVPSLREGRPYEGLVKALAVIKSLAKGEYDSNAYGKRHSGKNNKGIAMAIVVIVVLLFLFFGGGRSGGMTIGRRGPFYWGGFGGWGGGGWGGGSSGGSGGWGGFGGGGFGGGGAGSKW